LAAPNRAKARGVTLGNPKIDEAREKAVAEIVDRADRRAANVIPITRRFRAGAKLTAKARQNGADANAEAAAARAADLAPVITELQANGATLLWAIASALNDADG
jgi:hypothetical protein